MGDAKPPAEGSLLAVIGDEDTITGFLLAGVGHVDVRRSSNFFIVNEKTPVPRIEAAFKDFTTRPDIAVVLISQHVATSIRSLVDAHSAAVPAVLEVPSSGTPYSPDTDTVFQRVKALFGGDVSAITAGGGEEEGGGGD